MLRSAATAATDRTAGTVRSLRRPGVARDVSGRRARTQGVHQVVVLGLLGSGKVSAEQLLVECGNLRVLRGDLLLGQLVQHSAGIIVLVGDDVPRHGLHSIPGVASLGADVVVDSAQSLLGVAAATGNQGRKRVLALQRGNGLRVEALLDGSAESVDFAGGVILLVADGGVEVGKAKVYGVAGVLDFTLHVLEGHVLAQLAASEGLTTAAVTAEAAAKAAPSPSENEEQNYEPSAIATPHAGIVIATIPGAGCDVSGRHRIHGERH